MTVPPNQPPKLPDETPPQNESPPTNATPQVPDVPTAPDGTATRPPHVPPPTTTDQLPSPPATTYLSGIVTAGLAAICGAIFTSWAGVQGTLVGAMIGATIGSSVSEIVRAPLDTLERRLVTAGVSARRLRRDGVVKTIATSPAAAQQVFGMISRGAVVTVGAIAIVGFLLAVGGVTAVEVAAGEPLAAMVSDSSSASGTTIGNALPDPPAVFAPASQPASQSSPGGRSNAPTSSKPADPVLGSEDPAVAVSPTPPQTSTAADDGENTNGAAPAIIAGSPEATGSPDAAEQATSPAARPSATAVTQTTPASPAVVQVVTVVVTATPTPTVRAPTAATVAPTQPAGTPTATGPTQQATGRTAIPVQTATSTLTPTPTPTPTSTATVAPAAP